MNINQILTEYDAMFGNADLTEIENFLVGKLTEARMCNAQDVQITLLNEIIGFCRDTAQKEKALNYCEEYKALLVSMDLVGTVAYATALLNIANAYRAFGLLGEATALYDEVQCVYTQHSDIDPYMYASLFNNWGLVYQSAGDYYQAKEMFEKALKILQARTGAVIQQATTRVNMAEALLQIGTDAAYIEALENLKIALDIFEKDGKRDFHYSAALVAMGDAFSHKNDYEQAASYYNEGLTQIEKFTGRNGNYEKVLEKYNYVKQLASMSNNASGGCSSCAAPASQHNISKDAWVSNLQRSREFYENHGRKMIHDLFPAYESRIAVGLVGEGSDCFGFDDEISSDHDYAVGFCMWLTDEDYHKIGDQLQRAYENLVAEVYCKKEIDRFLQERRGVFTIYKFYSNLLDFDTYSKIEGGDPVYMLPPLETLKEFQLAVATNGQIFRDDLGIFTAVRNKLLCYYPDEYRRRKIAQELHEFSQYAQSNYPRMMARGDQLTANMCIAKAVENAMNLVYILNKSYAPYYKWKRKGLGDFSCSVELQKVLDKIAQLPPQGEAWKGIKYSATSINMRDEVVALFEEAAQILVEAMKNRGLITGDELFMEMHIAEILAGSGSANKVQPQPVVHKNCDNCQVMNHEHENLVEEVLGLEWNQFQFVQNEGGRASCQDNYETFHIMRKSQYMAWTDELLKAFRNDLKAANEKGWNLITEKYARMMKDTNPDKYRALESKLPYISADRVIMQEAIIKIQVGWMEAFAKEFPNIAGNSRSIHTYEDNEYNTSYETYLRGEIGTYSEDTFAMYAKFVMDKLQKEQNLFYEIMDNTVKMYGYKSLQDANNKIS